jgi:hypothetical protein
MHARKAVWFYCMQPSKESPRDAVTFAHDRSVLWILTNTEQSRCHMKYAGLCASDQGCLEDCHRSMEDALGERGEGGGGGKKRQARLLRVMFRLLQCVEVPIPCEVYSCHSHYSQRGPGKRARTQHKPQTFISKC